MLHNGDRPVVAVSADAGLRSTVEFALPSYAQTHPSFLGPGVLTASLLFPFPQCRLCGVERGLCVDDVLHLH